MANGAIVFPPFFCTIGRLSVTRKIFILGRGDVVVDLKSFSSPEFSCFQRGLTSSVDGVLSRPTRKTPLVPSGADLDHVRQQLRDQESSHTAECTAYESKLEALTADGTQLRHQRDMEKERAKENERKALEYDGLFGQYRELQNSHGDATSSKDALQSDLAATRAENRTLVSKLEELHKSHMEWRSRVENDQEKQVGDFLSSRTCY